MTEFKPDGRPIVLMQLLKLTGIAQTGGQAGLMVEEGVVKLNGKTESRKRAQLKAGDVVECLGETVKII